MTVSITGKQERILLNIATETGMNEVEQYYRSTDLANFRLAAEMFNCYILVRRTNPESVQHIGKVNYVPKPVNCKPKTAKNDVYLMKDRTKKSECGGLVVKPQKVGLDAFSDDQNFADSVNLWRNNFEPLPAGFSLEEDEDSGHYGCVKQAASKHSKGGYIHGDYDLYGIVDAFDPAKRIQRDGVVNGLNHTHGKLWEYVADFLNERFGTPMIQHGGQEHFCYHTEENIDMFTPLAARRLRRLTIRGARNLERLYAEFFNGRMTKGRSIHYL
jgi:hypothetical protein